MIELVFAALVTLNVLMGYLSVSTGTALWLFVIVYMIAASEDCP